MKKNLLALFLLAAIAAGMAALPIFPQSNMEHEEGAALCIWVSDAGLRAECDGEIMLLDESIPATLGSASVTEIDSGAAVVIGYGDVSILAVREGKAVPNVSAAVLIFDGSGLTELPENPPEYAIISAPAAPGEEALRLLENNCKIVCRVDLQGEITLTTDGRMVSLSTQREADSKEIFPYRASLELTKRKPSDSYVINLNSKAFHLPSCTSVGQMKAENREISSLTREELIAQGYHPCGICRP